MSSVETMLLPLLFLRQIKSAKNVPYNTSHALATTAAIVRKNGNLLTNSDTYDYKSQYQFDNINWSFNCKSVFLSAGITSIQI
jgi:hypothetical protein